MSVKLDFDELPYDLFQLLELPEDCSTKDVKKAYKKAILKYHPDKNPEADEEYFSWVSLANKILSNPEHKELYLEWKNWKDDHERLRNLQNSKVNVNTSKTYKEFEEELNMKHGYKTVDEQPLDPQDLSRKLNDMKNSRDKLVIPKVKITDMNDAVNNLKKNDKKLKENDQDIIKYSGELTTLPSSSKYGSLDNYGKLYGENEKVVTDKVTSFNEAFNLVPYQDYVEDNESLEDKIKRYENETSNLKKLSKKSKNIDFFK